MLYQEIEITAPGHPERAILTTYLLDHSVNMTVSEKRPLILICPGGGYSFCSDREGEPIAMQFLAMGIHAAVLWYSTSPARYPVALLQVASAVKYLKDHAREYHIDPDAIILEGCSAGGHLAASYGCFWNTEAVRGALQASPEQLRPGGLLLSYPVITYGEKAHRGSFENLLGERQDELGEAMSLEKQVNQDTPRTFLWHTTTDEMVPVENSLLFYQALHRHQIPAELHIYPVGVHGLSLATPDTAEADGSRVQAECTSWIALARTWIDYYRK